MVVEAAPPKNHLSGLINTLPYEAKNRAKTATAKGTTR